MYYVVGGVTAKANDLTKKKYMLSLKDKQTVNQADDFNRFS